MRRSAAVVAVVAVLALAGCSAGGEKTAAEPCTSTVSAWDKFERLAQTPGRADSAVIQERVVVLDVVTAATSTAPDWMKTQLTGIQRDMSSFLASSATDDRTEAYSSMSDRFEKIREQCTADGNLS